MSTLAPPLPEPFVRSETPPAYRVDLGPRWSPATIVAFRFCFIYFGLYVITTQMLGGLLPIPGLNLPNIAELRPFKALVGLVGTWLLGLDAIPYQPTGSGDTLHDWVQTFTLLLIAAFATMIWSMVSRPRAAHPRLYKWFRVFLRLSLGTTMLSYGLAKVIPVQMPVLALTRLVEPFGNFSPMGVLWYSVGASPAYEIATGCAETLAGILLLIPRTALLGGVVALFDVSMIFVLNMTYDVPVKLFSFHLILMSLVVLAPNAKRLFEIVLLHRSGMVAPEPPLAVTRRRQRGIVIAQIVFLVWVIGLGLVGSTKAWHAYGGGAPRSPLFGVWRVEEMAIDGKVRPPLLTDSLRWRHAIFQTPTRAVFQRMDDSLKGYTAAFDTVAKTLKLTGPGPKSPPATLTYSRPAADEAIIDGTMNGHRVHLRLKLRDLNSFLIRSRGFHWVQELPFNR